MANKSDTLYNTTIRASRSLHPVYNKNKAKWGGMGYEEVGVTVSEMIADISQGFAYTGCYGQTRSFTQKDKTKKNFTHTNIIAFDLDDSPVGMEETISGIEMKPSFAYTTPNHGKKGNRFRLIYILSKPVDGHEYERNYDYLRQGMGADHCMRNYTQTIGGTIPTAEWWYGEDLYEPIPADVVTEKGDEPAQRKRRTRKEWATDADNKYVGRKDCELSKQFCDDFFSLSPIEFLDKYRDIYEYFCASKVEYNEGYALLGDDYYEIRRRWHIEKTQTKSGERNVSVVDTLKDGMKRRRMLYTAGIIMRRIMPEITIEHLVYNLVYERTYYYDNSDKVLSNKRLLITAQNVIKTENIRMRSDEKRRFKIDKLYWSEVGLTARQAVAVVSKGLRWKEIGEHYKPDFTDKENVALMKEAGLKVSVSTLKRWRLENGITKYNKKPSDAMTETSMNDSELSPLTDPGRAINSAMRGDHLTAWEYLHTYRTRKSDDSSKTVAPLPASADPAQCEALHRLRFGTTDPYSSINSAEADQSSATVGKNIGDTSDRFHQVFADSRATIVNPEYDRVDAGENFIRLLDGCLEYYKKEKDENQFYRNLSFCYGFVFWEATFGGFEDGFAHSCLCVINNAMRENSDSVNLSTFYQWHYQAIKFYKSVLANAYQSIQCVVDVGTGSDWGRTVTVDSNNKIISVSAEQT